MLSITKVSKRASRILASLALLTAQMTPFFVFNVEKAAAAPICTNDQQGANDVNSQQRDLTKLCVDSAGLPTSVVVIWNWDKLNFTGSNTGDACALFDTDNDGFANYATCVSIAGNPASQISTSPDLYSCGDTRFDRCTGSVLLNNGGPYSTTCSVSTLSTDPFASGEAAPEDTVASCVIAISEVGGVTSKLIDVCSLPSQTVNSDPADCIISTSASKLEVRKSLSPTNDSGQFNLSIDAVVYASAVGSGGTTGERSVTNSTHEFRETAATGSSLVNYTINVECRAENGTGTTLSVTTISTGRFSVEVPSNSDVVCIISNTRQPGSITLIKNVTNDNGGNATSNQFGLSIGGTSVTSGQTLSLNPGSYAVNELGLTGYQFTSITGTGCPTQLGGNVVLASNQNVTCTITNNDVAPSLTLVKSVTNDNGGSAGPNDFGLTVGGNSVQSGVKNTYAANTALAINETQLAGQYAFTSITGNAKCPSVLGGTVTLAPGDDITCTITNNDIAPSLTLVKQVTNNNGGTRTAVEWNVTATGSAANPTNLAGNGGATSDAIFKADTYTLAETGPTDYSPSLWTCTNSVSVVNGQITLVSGKSTTCTIYNDDDAPTLTLVKLVVNNNGGTSIASAWTLIAQAGADQPVVNQQGTVVASTNNLEATTDAVPVSAGIFYTLSESGPSGYTAGSWDCLGGTLTNGAVKLALDSSVTCTITNNDIAPQLTVIKHVVNDNGGLATAADFDMQITSANSGYRNFDGSETGTTIFIDAGAFNVAESGPGGYGASLSNDCGGTIAIGVSKTCTVTNNDIAPSLTLNKIVSNTHGGDAAESAWTLTATSTNNTEGYVPTNLFGPGAAGSIDVVSGSDFKASTYTLSESTGPTGYSASAWTCTGGITVTNNQITLALGQTTVCSITNSDVAPTLTVTKSVLNPYGTALPVSSFPLFVDGTSVTSGTANTQFNAGTRTITETQQTGYTLTGATGNCTTSSQGVISILLSLAGSSTCTLTNTAIQPKLTVTKVVINDNGGSKVISDFPLFVNQTSVTSGVQNGFNTGSYTISETSDPGYEFSITGDCSGNGEITLNLGDVKSCTITNNDIAPKLKLVKTVINDNGGTKQVSDFPLYINGNQVTSGEPNVLLANTLYTATETTQTGYAPSAWGGHCATDGTITLLPGDNKTCTITNNDQPATLILVKDLPNDNGGTAVESDFNVYIDEVLSIWGSHSVDAGTYTVSEDTVDGYAPSDWYTDCGEDGSVTLLPGETKTCTITNDDIAPSLTVVKKVKNDNGGNATAADFDIKIGETELTFVTGATVAGITTYTATPSVSSNTNYTLSEIDFAGYAEGTWDCGQGEGRSTTVNLNEAQSVTCTITNDDIAPPRVLGATTTITTPKVTPKELAKTGTDHSYSLIAGLIIVITGIALTKKTVATRK